MHRLVLGLVLLAGCATTRSAETVRAECQDDVRTDPRCMDLLTRPEGGYEAEAEVNAAEEARKAGAFQDRLARLRAAHEARTKGKIRTATAAAGLEAPFPAGPRISEETPDDDLDDLERQLADVGAEDDPIETGSSVRAIRAAPPVVQPKILIPKKRDPPTFGPTPEALLRGARCVLTADRAALADRLAALKSQRGASRSQMGALALLMLDTQSLGARVQAELDHRKLAKDGPLCSSSALSGAVRHLRAILGEAPSDAAALDRYGRGLESVVTELQIRAGLPRAE